MANTDEADSDFLTDAPMLADIWRQPRVLIDVTERIDEIKYFFNSFLSLNKTGKLYIFGSGDGLFASRIIATREAKFVAVSGLEMLANVSTRLKPEDIALAVSMSGNVDRTVEAAEAVVKNGNLCGAVVNGEGGRLGTLNLPLFSIDIHDIAPFLCGTSSYIATLEILQLFSAIKNGSIDEAINAIQNTAIKLKNLLPELNKVCKEIAESIGENITGVRILSLGEEGLATADYGAAKLVELTSIRPYTDDIEEFAHCQFWSADPNDFIIYIPNSILVSEVASRSAKALREMGFSTLSLGPDCFSVTSTNWSIKFGDLNNSQELYFLATVTLQLLAYHLAMAVGFDPNKRQHLINDKLRFRVSRKLTRRHLLSDSN